MEILSHTPSWVFILLLALLVLGYRQTKKRVVAARTIVTLPLMMTLLSLSGILSTFGQSVPAIVAWGLGVSLLVAGHRALIQPERVRYIAEDNSFELPGSWLPLMLMMAIFFTKFGVAVALARQFIAVHDLPVMLLVSLAYGGFSGVFISRALMIWRVKQSGECRSAVLSSE